MLKFPQGRPKPQFLATLPESSINDLEMSLRTYIPKRLPANTDMLDRSLNHKTRDGKLRDQKWVLRPDTTPYSLEIILSKVTF